MEISRRVLSVEVVLRCENYFQFHALTVVDLTMLYLCGLARISLLVSSAGCYYRLAFHRWLLINQLFELTVQNNDKGRNSIAALVQSMPPVDWTSL